MTRRAFTGLLPVLLRAQSSIIVPVKLIVDPGCTPRYREHFLMEIWTEAVRDFRRCGIQLDYSEVTSDVRRAPSGRPVFTELQPAVINVVLTDRVPLEWDEGRALQGVTTLYEGKPVCLIALKYAHVHQIPFLSVNTAVHELLHVLMHDVFERRARGLSGSSREFRIDYYATRLWLLHDGAAIHEAARLYIQRIRNRS